mmetsp:Transcript_13421/g.27270  ORF Transcript_13421/g.27270 Transcript_13421/m.27270 type:complete len:468 (+) Transcript_13421:227-1630(+)
MRKSDKLIRFRRPLLVIRSMIQQLFRQPLWIHTQNSIEITPPKQLIPPTPKLHGPIPSMKRIMEPFAPIERRKKPTGTGVFVKIQNLRPTRHPTGLLPQKRIHPARSFHIRPEHPSFAGPIRPHVGSVFHGHGGGPSYFTGVESHSHGADVRFPQEEIVFVRIRRRSRPSRRDAAANGWIESSYFLFVAHGGRHVVFPFVMIYFGVRPQYERVRRSQLPRVQDLRADESGPQSSQLLRRHGIVDDIVTHRRFVRTRPPSSTTIFRRIWHVDLPIRRLLRHPRQSVDLHRHLQKIDDVIRRDPHIVLKRQEEIVVQELVPHHEPMLPRQPVRRQFDRLIVRFEIPVVFLLVKIGNGIVPRLESHSVRQSLRDHLPPRFRQRLEPADQIHVDVPSPLDHAGDAVDHEGEDEVLEPIGSGGGAAGAPVVFAEGGDDEEDAEGGFVFGEGVFGGAGGEGEGAFEVVGVGGR